MRELKGDIQRKSLTKKVSFAKAGYSADIYDTKGEVLVARNVPLIRVRDIEVRIERDAEGTPFRTAYFMGIIPLTPEVENNAQLNVTSIRRGSVVPYEIDEIDDDETRWIMYLDLKRRNRPVGRR